MNHAKRLERVMELADEFGVETDCLDAIDTETPEVPFRFAVREFGGTYNWITFFDNFEDCKKYADGCPFGDSPWAADRIVDLDTGEEWEVLRYEAIIGQVTHR